MIDTPQFFEENYITDGMKQLLSEAFNRLEGKSQSTSDAFILSQSMGAGKTHNLLALGLLATRVVHFHGYCTRLLKIQGISSPRGFG